MCLFGISSFFYDFGGSSSILLIINTVISSSLQWKFMFSDEVHKFSGEVHKFSDEVHKFSDVKHKIHFVSKSFLTGFNYLPTKPATTTFKILA